MALHDDYQDTLFGGVALRNHTLETLQQQRDKITQKIIYYSGLLEGMRCSRPLEVCRNCSDRNNQILQFESDLDIINSELESRYAEAHVFA